MQITKEILIACGADPRFAARYVLPLNSYLPLHGINTPLRVAHLLAQLLHESDRFRASREYATGAAYEGRKDLGNVTAGDGVRFAGRGLIQITGRSNYMALSKNLGVDYLNNPAWMQRPDDAVRVSLWYWTSRNLNKWADADNVMRITKLINGGINGLSDRINLVAKCKEAFCDKEVDKESGGLEVKEPG